MLGAVLSCYVWYSEFDQNQVLEWLKEGGLVASAVKSIILLKVFERA